MISIYYLLMIKAIAKFQISISHRFVTSVTRNGGGWQKIRSNVLFLVLLIVLVVNSR